jgi:hypothetical protein
MPEGGRGRPGLKKKIHCRDAEVAEKDATQDAQIHTGSEKPNPPGGDPPCPKIKRTMR